jgi:hypothetical protein
MLAAIFHLNLQRSRAGRALPARPAPGRTSLRLETMEHGGEYPDTMPQAIKLIDAVPILRLRADYARQQGGRQPRVYARG